MRKLYIEPASTCNFNCKMCFRHNWKNETTGLMSQFTFQNIVSGLKGRWPEKVVFGGMGEPLLQPSLSAWIRIFHEFGCQTELISNFSLMNEERCLELCQAGLDRAWVSIDSVLPKHYETIQDGGRYRRLVENMETFRRTRAFYPNVHLGITYVILPDNLSEIAHLNHFADSIDADLIHLSHAIPNQPVFREETAFDMDLPVGLQHRIGEFHKEYSPRHCRFLEEENAFIRWDGDIAPCMQLLHETDTWMFGEQRKIMRKSFGNVNSISLMDAWNSQEYRAFRQRVIDFDFPDCISCDGCELRKENETDCMMHDFPTCGACLWSLGKVFCP